MKDEIFESYKNCSLNYIGNSNSLHELGLNSRKIEDAAGKQILDILGLNNKEIVYTSGNAESYTLIIENIDDNKNIVTDNKALYDVCVEMGKNVKFGDVKKLIDDKTALISTFNFYSFNNYNGLIHVDISNNYRPLLSNDIDFITIEDDIPFFGCLIKNKNKELLPIIHGGKSTTKYRSGTTPTPLIVSFSKLIRFKYKK